MQRSLKILCIFVLPCLFVESAYKIWWYASGASQIPFLGNVYLSDAVACVMEILSWLYRTTIIFLVCVLFRLVCSLQILRLQDFAQLFQENLDVASVMSEHLRIRRHLRIISHRYRVFILWSLMLVTGSQLASLLVTTKSSSEVNIYRAGELAVSIYWSQFSACNLVLFWYLATFVLYPKYPEVVCLFHHIMCLTSCFWLGVDALYHLKILERSILWLVLHKTPPISVVENCPLFSVFLLLEKTQKEWQAFTLQDVFFFSPPFPGKHNTFCFYFLQ